MTDEQKRKLAELLEKDVPLVEIARELGMGFQTLKLRMAEQGLKVRRVLVEEAR